MAERLVFENSSRLNQIMYAEMGKGWALYDPQCDEPLDPLSESNMNQMGPSAFLQMLCVQYGVEVDPAPRTEWECERAARKTVRTKINAWKGERFIQ